jgi:hypothetical protein
MRELCDCDNCITECTDRPNCQILARINRHNDTITIPRADLERLQRDAERYRWLKSHARKIEWFPEDEKKHYYRETLDADIDAAIAASKDTRADLDQGKGEHGE